MTNDTQEPRVEQPLAPATREEKELNRGVVTVFEQVRDGENVEEGDRYLMLGYDTERYQLVNESESGQDFVVSAVPVAHIELATLLDEDDGLTEWLNSDAGRLAVSPFFDELDAPDVLTERGRERDIDV